MTTTGVVVALLRGINVGGHARIPMNELRSVVETLGVGEVRTYLQSGNLVLAEADDEVGVRCERAIASHFGLDVRVLVRTAEEIGEVVAANPFPVDGLDPRMVHAVFLEAVPSAEAVERLDPDRSPPDRFVVSGTEIYLHYPNGSGRSKLDLGYFERTLGVRGTARNWNTVTALLEMAS